MPKQQTTKVVPYRGYDLAETYKEGRLTHCDVWDEDKHVRSFYGAEARDKAKRWVLQRIAQEKYPRISMRRVSSGR